MDVFCDVLIDGDGNVSGFGMNISLEIAVGSGSILIPSPYKESMSDFFSNSTQQALLQPFRNRLRGFKKAKVRGLVDRDIAKAAEEDIAQDIATDPEAVVKDFQAQKDEGQNLYKARNIDEACLKWQDATLEIETLRGGSSWPTLIDKGGVPFVARLAEIYFLMKLNIIHVKISGISKHEFYADLLAKDNMEMILQSLKKDYWMPGYRWQPSDMQKAKLRYRQALLIRLTDEVRSAQTAVRSIELAHRLFPDDAVIARERTAVLAWSAGRL
jgi:hypothetical protein